MKTRIVDDVEISFPEPVYVDFDTLSHNEVTGEITGQCMFPSTDQSIADRVDHANQAHLLFVMWNCAAIIRTKRKWKRTLAHSVIAKSQFVIPPDTRCDFRFTLMDLKGDTEIRGIAQTDFMIGGRRQAYVRTHFVAIAG